MLKYINMEDGLCFKMEKRLYFVSATYIYTCSYKYSHPSDCMVEEVADVCLAKFIFNLALMLFTSWIIVRGFLMVFEHCLVSSQFTCCIRTSWKCFLSLYSKLLAICQLLCVGTAQGQSGSYWVFTSHSFSNWKLRKEKELLQHQLNLRILQNYSTIKLKESLLSAHCYNIRKKAPEALLQAAGN